MKIKLGTIFNELRVFEKQIGEEEIYKNVKVRGVRAGVVLLESESGELSLIEENSILSYDLYEKLVTVSYKKSEDEKEKTYTNWVLEKKTFKKILISKEINGVKLYRKLDKSKVKDIKEMN